MRFLRIAKALADPRRLEILELLSAAGELTCGEVVEGISVGQSTVSHHLRILVDSGLVSVRRCGQHALYRVQRGSLEGYLKVLRQRLHPGAPGPETVS
ncbi:MAG: metalloregulator ArsR/SmtB family transcription factor [Polyangiaceae bacterium]